MPLVKVCDEVRKYGKLPTSGLLLDSINEWRANGMQLEMWEWAFDECEAVVPLLGGGAADVELATKACEHHERCRKWPENKPSREAKSRWEKGGIPLEVRAVFVPRRRICLVPRTESL